MNLDRPDYQTPNDEYTFAQNATFLTHEGNELILQNEKGTTFKSQLKENYVPLAIKDYEGIAYIVSAEVINDQFTGRGEIGSFPSPDYANTIEVDCTSEGCNYETQLIPEYQPFQNYRGDNNNPINSLIEPDYGEFNSEFFNFQRDYPVEIVAVQTSYDDSVNVIFTDHFNKPKLINSRFSVLPNNRVRIINRFGSNDTNVYSADNFNNTLNHIFTSNKLVTVTFDGQQTGGNLPAGQYRYFFQYTTADGNNTNVVAESFNIPVFFGNTVATTRGGLPNENTNKSNILTLYNIDTAYSALRIFFQYSAGTVGADATQTVYQIDEEFLLQGDTFRFIHTGFENITAIENEVLTVDTAPIETYRTGCEIQGRLAVANIKTKDYNSALLRDFAKQIKIFTNSIAMSIPGVDNDIDHSAIYSTLSYDTKVLDTFTGAYYNPRNVHDYLGYWGGESYMFGVAFIFSDNTYSPIYPIRGIDNLEGTATYTSNDFIDDDFDELSGENVRGIYRFPLRTVEGFKDNVSNSAYKVYHPTFEIPDLPQEILDEGIVGYRIFRSRRKIDCIGQGMLINTIIAPRTNYANRDNWYNFYKNEGYRESNSRYLPTYNFIYDAIGRKAKFDSEQDGTYISARTPDLEDIGVEMMIQNLRFFISPDLLDFYIDKKFAFISPDFICNPVVNQRLFATDNFTFLNLGRIQSVYAIKSNTPFELLGGRGSSAPWRDPGDITTDRSFSLIKQSNFIEETTSNFTICKAEYVTGSVVAATARGFSSRIRDHVSALNFQNYEEIFGDNQGNREERKNYVVLSAVYNDYIGITTEDAFNLGNTIELPTRTENNDSVPAESSVTVFFNGQEYTVSGVGTNTDSFHLNGFNFTNNAVTSEETSILINLYADEGPRITERLKEFYNPVNETYFPITQPIYASTAIATTLNANPVNGVIQSKDNLTNTEGRIPAFNGDCFLNLTHRRLYHSDLEVDGNLFNPGFHASNVGYSVAFVAESNYNVAGRYENIVNVNEESRTFLPYAAREHNEVNSTSSVKAEDDLWRTPRELETKQYNTGYDSFEGGRNYIAISRSVPFIQNRFDTRVWISQPYTSTSFENGYRFFFPLAFRDYARHLGEIVSIKSLGSSILCVHEFGIIQIPVAQRIAQQGDSAGAVFFEAADVLSPPQNVAYLSNLHGSQWQFSVCQTDNAIYGVDLNTSKIWRTSGGSLSLISDLKVQSFLRKIKPLFENQTYEWFNRQVRTYHDKRRGDLLFTFAATAGADVCGFDEVETPPTRFTVSGDENGILVTGGTPGSTIQVPKTCYDDSVFNIVFNEQMNFWKTFNSWYPVNVFLIHDEMYSFPLIGNRNFIYKHYDSDLYSFYYDEQHDFVVEINVISSTRLHQTYDNLMLITNEFYPYKIEYTTSTGTLTQTVRPRNVEGLGSEPFKQAEVNPITLADFVYKEDHMYGEIRADSFDSRERTDRFGNQAPIFERRVRDKFCKIRFYYNTTNNLYIQQIITKVHRSFS